MAIAGPGPADWADRRQVVTASAAFRPAVGLTAGYMPALRAASIDAMTALRHE